MLMYTIALQKKKYISTKLAWFVDYLALSANRNMFKKHISASPTWARSTSVLERLKRLYIILKP